MKNSNENINKRREEILQLIKEAKTINVNELLEEVNTSIATLRRDLQYFRNKHIIDWNYGTITYIAGLSYSEERKKVDELIGKRAAEYVDDDDIIFINSSMTALNVIKYIDKKNIIIITNNANIINIDYDPSFYVILTGGELHKPSNSLTGDFTSEIIEGVRVNKCFVGCSGISSEFGITTAIQQEASVNNDMVENCAGRVFLLADYSKIGRSDRFSTMDINSIDCLITDYNADPYEIEKISKKNKNLRIVKIDTKRRR